MKNKRKDRQGNAYAEECIRKDLEKIFHGVEHEIVFAGPANYRSVMITYTDFKNEEDVRKEVEAVTGYWVKPIVKREFSEKFIKDTMYDMFKDMNLYILMLDNRLSHLYQERFREFVRSYLKERK